ncbi:transcriptional regulator with XRE-family HTH domain [Naumannella cuiyingiana]|uniref:Transcriptional regulator with XRE-family HTH domain n=1 Tax=Naumannella cuiyingiana TaxID=1347891 RepID=A0A7Z0ILY3_9ACTN|nr:transcriptional regulator with XRE-family HTH domain [Naumannella cuiyingiana]
MTASSFQELLLGWRQRRRVSQLDLAVAAGTTQRYLSFLESGRSAPGSDIVVRLGAALDLDLRQRNSLLAAAGFAPRFDDAPLGSRELSTVRRTLQLILTGHEPLPAVLVRSSGVPVAANSAMTLLLEGVAPHLLSPPINLYRLALHPDGLARRVVNFAAWAVHVIRAVEARAATNPDPALDELARELRGYLPHEAATDLLAGTIAPMVLRTPFGDATLITTAMGFRNTVHTALDELQLEAFLPTDDATLTILRKHAAAPPSVAATAALAAVRDSGFTH